MPDRSFAVDVRFDGGDAVLVLAGDLDLATVPQLESALARAFGGGGGGGGAPEDVERVVVDMAAVEFIDSSGLTALIKAHRATAEAGASLVVRSPSERVRRTLQLTQLDGVLDVER